MEWLIVGICVALIALVCGLALAAGRADDHAERCADEAGAEQDILDEMRSYSGDGWQTRHRRVADEVRGVDEIDRYYIESEGQE